MPKPEDWPQTPPLPRPQPPDPEEARGVVERFEEEVPDGVPDGRVPIGATLAPDWPDLEPPGARSRGGDPPVGLEVLVRLWRPTALSKTLLVGPAVGGLAVLDGRGLGSAGAEA